MKIFNISKFFKKLQRRQELRIKKLLKSIEKESVNSQVKIIMELM